MEKNKSNTYKEIHEYLNDIEFRLEVYPTEAPLPVTHQSNIEFLSLLDTLKRCESEEDKEIKDAEVLLNYAFDHNFLNDSYESCIQSKPIKMHFGEEYGDLMDSSKHKLVYYNNELEELQPFSYKDVRLSYDRYEKKIGVMWFCDPEDEKDGFAGYGFVNYFDLPLQLKRFFKRYLPQLMKKAEKLIIDVEERFLHKSKELEAFPLSVKQHLEMQDKYRNTSLEVNKNQQKVSLEVNKK